MSSIHDERMARFQEAGLYLVTSAALSEGRTTAEIVAAALAGGARLIQLREKELPAGDFVALARAVRRLTTAARALLIINDRLDVALAVGADGVHLGQEDFPIEAARALAPNMILGASTHNEAELAAAERAGASYVNIGPIYPTQTKNWTEAYLGLEGLRLLGPLASVPFTVMGGIKAARIPELVAAGARTLAVVTEVTAAADPQAATREFLSELAAARAA